MASSPRRTSGPGGSRRPGGSRTGNTGAARTSRTGQTGRGPAADTGSQAAVPPPRFTGRAVVLVLVLAALTMSYASSMRAYITQRSHIQDLKAAIAERETSINALEREKRRWEDPAFVKAQARERFGYLMPGETGYQVLGEDGKPLESQTELADPADAVKAVPSPWWSDAWDSVELAGHPPKADDPATRLVDGTKQ